MIKIGIDARFTVHNRRGIGNYTLNLIRGLAEIDSHNEYILYIDKDDSENILPKQDNFKIKKLLPSNYLVWEQFVLPMQVKKDGVDILHCTGNTAPIFISRSIKIVLTICDVMYLKKYSELPKSVSCYQRIGRLYRKLIVPRTISHVSMVLTISDFSKEDILKHIPQLDKDRIKVVYLAANEGFGQINKISDLQKIKNKFGIDCDYILILGATDPRKNIELAIKTFIELKKESKIDEKLLIIGVPDWRRTRFYSIIRESPFAEDIIFAEFVFEDELALLYRGASMFLYPSLYEGFGMPILEAMICGTPVITSNVTSIPEIAGDAAFLINPNNAEELKKSMLKLLNDESLRNKLVQRGFERAPKFSWRKTAVETLAIYETVYKVRS
jgi:glycosyltransferase involved in cell wall biosynthesis